MTIVSRPLLVSSVLLGFVLATGACSSKTSGTTEEEGDAGGGGGSGGTGGAAGAAGASGADGSAGRGGAAGTAGSSGSPDGGEDTSPCPPTTVTGYTPPTLKPVAGWKTNKCTTTQIGTYVAACILNNDTSCETFVKDAANAQCVACIETPETAAAYGAFIVSNGQYIDNTYGCMEHFKAGCGSAAAGADKCGELACAVSCNGKATSSIQACLQGAGAGTCKTYLDSANNACNAVFGSTAPSSEAQATCYGNKTDTADSFYKRYIGGFCGAP